MNVARQYALSLTTIFFLFITDFVFTKQIIDITGFEAEANPMMHWFLMGYQSIWILLVVKIFTLLLLFAVASLVLARARIETKKALVYILWALTAAIVLVNLWSVYVLRVVS